LGSLLDDQYQGDVFLSQAFAKRLLARERPKDLFYSIVNVTSSNANAVAVQRAEYCASKAAAAMVSKALAVRLGSEDIAVYDIQPGLIATDMTAPVIESYKKRAEEGLTLFPRVGQPEEIGTIIATLASGKLPIQLVRPFPLMAAFSFRGSERLCL